MPLRAHPDGLHVHQLSAAVSAEVVFLARSFHGPGALPRGDQIVKAALSITSNIAEAGGRNTVAEFRQFLGYARGSAFELRSQLLVARSVEPAEQSRIRSLEGRVTLVIKLLDRLQQHPPPER